MIQDITIGQWLEREIERRGGTMRLVAQRTGISASTIHNIITGKHTPSSATCVKLAAYFKVDPDYLLELAGHREPKPLNKLNRLHPRLKVFLARIAELDLPLEDQQMIANMIEPVIIREEEEIKRRREARTTKNEVGEDEERSSGTQ